MATPYLLRVAPVLPPVAAWRHHGARDGFEVAFLRRTPGGWEIQGSTAAVEGGQPWAVRYLVAVTDGWLTQHVEVSSLSPAGEHRRLLDHDGAGTWWIDGARAPHLTGCLDVDLESSAVTNTLPVHRLALAVSAGAEAPAAYVRALDLGVERLEQRYQRRADGVEGQRYDYTAPGLAFSCRLAYDHDGLVTRYPGLATRVR
jgi:hypothetical protein